MNTFMNYSCFLLLCPIFSLVAESRNTTFPAVIVFGDSVVDTGNNNYLKTLIKVNYPPYGRDFIGGRPTGRFSNGKVPSDLIAEELGIKDLLPAYLDPSLQADDLITGVNFASGGAGYDPLTSDFVHVLSLLDQIEMFKDYIAKLEQIVGLERTSALLSESLFIVVSGSNDITNTYFGMPVRKTQYDVTSYADLLVSYASIFVKVKHPDVDADVTVLDMSEWQNLVDGVLFLKELYELGARKIGVFGLPPLGCLPSQRTLKGGVERKCIDLYNEVAMLFNHKLSAEINSINNQCSTGSGRATYIDIYSLPLDLIHHPHKYGFKISNKGCCGTGTIEVAFLCKYTCWNVPEYVFWDSFHLTEKAYRLLVHEILKNNIKSLIL